MCIRLVDATRAVRIVAALALLSRPDIASAQGYPTKFDFGAPASAEEIAEVAIAIAPDGKGLPAGKGSVAEGKAIYATQCVACHGEDAKGGPMYGTMVGGIGSFKTNTRVLTPGSMYPYAPILFDYIRRAMPFGNAQSLSNDELYAVTAYVLNLNDIVDDKFVLSKATWKQVKMPNAGGFYDDDRETTEKAFWNKNPCMKDCGPPVNIIGRARAVDVTPDDKTQRGVE